MESVDNLDDLLKKLLGAIPEIKAVAIVSAEGLPIASALPQGVDETKIAAMTAALLSLSEKAIIEMRKGDFDQLYIKGSEGYLLVMQAGPNAVLIVSTTKDVRLGLILLDLGRHLGNNLPYPYILNPPKPPDDFAMAPQVQLRCQYCGMKLTKEEQSTHSCKKKPK